MRVVIAPDKLKGTYSAPEAAEALAAGWRSVRPGDDLVLVPMADGGAGLRDAIGEVPAGVELVAALDVDNPLLGPHGAAATYAPQKGASPEQVAELERRLAALGMASADRPGAGAGGGIGGMLMELGAHAVPGAALIADEVGLDRRLAGAGLCITAEGRIDEQTLHGKAVAETVARARAAGVPAVAVGGQVRLSAGRLGAEVLECGDLERAGRELAISGYPR